jgi:predicted nucleic acid-binding protein
VSRIFWDTNLFIYLIEDFRDLSERVINLRRRMVERGDELYTSALTLGEILIKPLEAGDDIIARRYEAALLQGAVIIPFDVEPARLYANIRKDRTIRPPDAIQLACAAHARIVCLSPTMSG